MLVTRGHSRRGFRVRSKAETSKKAGGMSNGNEAGTIPLSGEQHIIEHGELRAVIASVGASLRELSRAGRDYVVPFAADELRPHSRGVTVAPWPNRVVDGRYRFDGVEHQLPITEVARGHALHGFTPWLGFAPGERFGDRAGQASSVTLTATVEPQRGYPWRVRIDTRFALDERGLEQTVTATNLSGTAAPYGVCPHPYLIAGPSPLDEWELTLPASQVLRVTEDRLIPVDLQPVGADAERFDYRVPRAIGGTRLDHAFTALARDASGEARVELRDPAGGGVAMSWGEACDWMQVFTADAPGDPDDRIGLAVEPMTCAPDAFNGGAGRGMIRLEPGASHTASWRIDPL